MTPRTIVTLAWVVVFVADWSIWGAQVALCALALMVLAQTVITEFTASPDDSR